MFFVGMTVPVSTDRYSFRKKHRKKDFDIKPLLDVKGDTSKVHQSGGALSRSASRYRNRYSNRTFRGSMLERARSLQNQSKLVLKQSIQSALSKRSESFTGDTSNFMKYMNNLYGRLKLLSKDKSTVLNDRTTLLDDSSYTIVDTNALNDSRFTDVKSSQTEMQQNIARFELLNVASQVNANEQANNVNSIFKLRSETSSAALATIAGKYTTDLASRRKDEVQAEFGQLKEDLEFLLKDLKVNVFLMSTQIIDVKRNIDIYTPQVAGIIQSVNATTFNLEAQVVNAYIGLYNMNNERQAIANSIRETGLRLTLSNFILEQISARFVPSAIDITPYDIALSTAETNKNNFSPEPAVLPSKTIPLSISDKISTYLSSIYSAISTLNITIIQPIITNLNDARTKLTNLPGQIRTSLSSYRSEVNNLNQGLLTASARTDNERKIQRYRAAESSRDGAISLLSDLGNSRTILLNPDMPVFIELNNQYEIYTGYITELNTTSVPSYLPVPLEIRYDFLTSIIVYQKGRITSQRIIVDSASGTYSTYIGNLNTAYDTYVDKRDSFLSHILIPRPSTADKDTAASNYVQQVERNKDNINNFNKSVSDNFKSLYYSIKSRFNIDKGSKNTDKKNNYRDARAKKSSIPAVIRKDDLSSFSLSLNLLNLNNILRYTRNILFQQTALKNIHSRRILVELERPPLENNESITMKGYIESLKGDKGSNEGLIQAVYNDLGTIPSSRTLVSPDPTIKNNKSSERETTLGDKRTLEDINIDLNIRSKIILVKYKSEILRTQLRKLSIENNTSIATAARNLMYGLKNTYMASKMSSNGYKLGLIAIIDQMRSRFSSSITSITSVFGTITDFKAKLLSVKTLLINVSAKLESARFKLMTNLYGTITLPLVIKLNILQIIDGLKQKQAINLNVSIQDILNIVYPTRTLPDINSLSINLENKFNLLSMANKSIDTINTSLNNLRNLLSTHIYSRIMSVRYNVIGGIQAVGTQSISLFYASKNTFSTLCLTARQRTIEFFGRANNLKNNLERIVDVTSKLDVGTKPVAPSRTALDNAQTTISQLLNMNKDLQYRLSFLYNSFKQVEKNLKIALSTRDYLAVLSNPIRNPMKLLSNITKTTMYSNALSIKNSISISLITKYGSMKQSLNNLKGLLSNKLSQYINYITTSRLDIFDKDGRLKSLRSLIQTLRAERTQVESQIISLKTEEAIITQQIKDGYDYDGILDKLNALRTKIKSLQDKINDINNRIITEQNNMDRLKREIMALKKLRDSLKVNDPSMMKYLGPVIAGIGGIAILGSLSGLFSAPTTPLQGPPQGQPNGNNLDEFETLDNGTSDGMKDGSSMGYADGKRDGLAEAQRQYKEWKSKNPDDTGIDTPEETNEAETEEDEEAETEEDADAEEDEEADAEEDEEADAEEDEEKK